MEVEIFFSLGSNIEPRRKYLQDGIRNLNKYFKLNKISSLYKTGPLIDLDQDDFYNLCASFYSEIKDPIEILKITKSIEKEVGRVKDSNRPKGPRSLDIDIIFIDRIILNKNELEIPHKDFINRRFVLEPLMEILNEDSYYNKKYNLKENLDKIKDQKVVKTGELYFGKLQ